jgi:serine/threonine-protein kinase
MGVVYRAHDERLDRDVALKVLAADLLSDKDAGKRFRLEARALSRLNHPNICAVYDFDSEQGVSFLATEYVAGRTLADVARGGPMAEGQLLPIAVQLTEGLAAAHREDVVHRDLKPSNLAPCDRTRPLVRAGLLVAGVPQVVDTSNRRQLVPADRRQRRSGDGAKSTRARSLVRRGHRG